MLVNVVMSTRSTALTYSVISAKKLIIHLFMLLIIYMMLIILGRGLWAPKNKVIGYRDPSKIGRTARQLPFPSIFPLMGKREEGGVDGHDILVQVCQRSVMAPSHRDKEKGSSKTLINIFCEGKSTSFY